MIAEEFELGDGPFGPSPSSSLLHARIRFLLERRFDDYFRRNPVGEAFSEVDCRIAEDTVRRPSLSVFLGARRQALDLAQVPSPSAPDIAIEVLSPSDRAMDLHRKIRDYLSAGSAEVWVLDQANSEVFAYSKTGARVYKQPDSVETPLLSGFTASVRELLVDGQR